MKISIKIRRKFEIGYPLLAIETTESPWKFRAVYYTPNVSGFRRVRSETERSIQIWRFYFLNHWYPGTSARFEVKR